MPASADKSSQTAAKRRAGRELADCGVQGRAIEVRHRRRVKPFGIRACTAEMDSGLRQTCG